MQAQKVVVEQGASVLCEEQFVQDFESLGANVFNLGKTETEMAARLYKLLREAEKQCALLVVIKPTKTDGIMIGVLNRLEKACCSQDVENK